MKLAPDYLLKEIAGTYVILPIGQNIVDFKKMLHLNETGAFLCRLLENGATYDELLDAMKKEYKPTKEEESIIQTDLDEFLNQLETQSILLKD